MSNRNVPVLEHGYLRSIGCIGRTRHLASCNNFARDIEEMLINIRTPLSPSSISQQIHLFCRTSTSGCFRLLLSLKKVSRLLRIITTNQKVK